MIQLMIIDRDTDNILKITDQYYYRAISLRISDYN